MAAPLKPNPTAGAAARRKIGDLTASNRLFDAGWLCLSPEDIEKLDGDLVVRLRKALTLLDLRVNF